GPIDRKQQGSGLGKERLLPDFVHLAHKLDLPAIDVRLELLLEVGRLCARYLGRALVQKMRALKNEIFEAYITDKARALFQ
ncbi:hypothetical protein JQ595_39370, partial [Bradyrhizobium japonicum]|nr:hypothetical protein [Bradyrhizobium japonicum]